jgi:hypothetical protein
LLGLLSTGWRWHLQLRPSLRSDLNSAGPTLYGLELLAARPTAFVMFVEGEKAADAVSHLLPTMIVAPQ